MADPMISVSPQAFRDAQAGHTNAANYLRTVPNSNEEIQACLDSLGPVYAEVRETARLTTLPNRKKSYEAQADDHDGAAAKLGYSVATWEQGEIDAREQFKRLV